MVDHPPCPIAGVRLRPLLKHHDARGTFTEVFRACWDDQLRPVQWNVVQSTSNVLRGVHVHVQHVDYVLVLAGRMLLGLSDVREESPTCQTGWLIELHADGPTAVEIPPGVAHGFYFPCPSLLLHGASEFFDSNDDLECRWNDPALHIPWPELEPVLSVRDQHSGSLAELRQELRLRLAGPTPRRRTA